MSSAQRSRRMFSVRMFNNFSYIVSTNQPICLHNGSNSKRIRLCLRLSSSFLPAAFQIRLRHLI